jgi:hypothetical protein
MKVKFADKVYEVLYTKEVAGKTMYAVEDEPNHIDWLVNVEVIDEESKDERIRNPSIKWNENTKENKPSICHSILMKTTHGIAEGEWRGEDWCQYRWSANHIKDSDVLAWMELSDLDKLFDKIKPKFTIGDWVTNGACTWRIDLIEDDLYCSNCGRFTCGGDIKSIDEQYHLWTIEDAKDGDVLVSACNKPFIYNGKFTEFTVGAHCGIDTYNDIILKNMKECNWTNNDDIKPATKEQRDFLLKEMHRVGYEWNTEKKVLKKIEQTPIWTEEDEKKRTLLMKILEVNHPHGLFKVNSSETMRTEELISWLKSINYKI